MPYLTLQPYGASFIDHQGKVHFLNDTATLIFRDNLLGLNDREIKNHLSSIFNIDDKTAENDIIDFKNQLLQYNIKNTEVLGNENLISIVQADISITNKCNLNCDYCYTNSGKADKELLPDNKWDKVIESLFRLGMRKATISGGEPILSSAFFPILTTLVEKGVIVQVFTNGLLFDTKIIEKLKSLPINFVQISLDATNSYYHNRYRGSSHAKALSIINKLAEAGVPVVIGANIFPDTIDEIYKLAKMASSLGILLRCNAIEYRGRAKDFELASTVVNKRLKSLIANKVEEVSRLFPEVFAEQEVKEDIEAHEHACPFTKGCIAITPNGEIRPCSQNDSFFSDVAEWVLDHRKAWEYTTSIEEHSAFREMLIMNSTHYPSEDRCKDCLKQGICNGCLLAGYSCFKGGGKNGKAKS